MRRWTASRLAGAPVAALLACLLLGIHLLWDATTHLLAATNRPSIMLDAILLPPLSSGHGPAALTLGRDQLLQNDVGGAVDERHVRIVRAESGWSIGNSSLRRHLFIRYRDGAAFFSNRYFLKDGDSIETRSGKVALVIRIVRNGSDTLEFTLATGSGAAAAYELKVNGRICRRDGPIDQRRCAGGDGALGMVKALVHRLRDAGGERELVRIGGPWIDIGGEGVPAIGVPDYAQGGLRLTYVTQRGFALAPGWDALAEISPQGRAANRLRFVDLEHPIADREGKVLLDEFIAGRTTYSLRRERESDTGSGLVLRVKSGAHRYRGEDGKALDTTTLWQDTLPSVRPPGTPDDWPRTFRVALAMDRDWSPGAWLRGVHKAVVQLSTTRQGVLVVAIAGLLAATWWLGRLNGGGERPGLFRRLARTGILMALAAAAAGQFLLDPGGVPSWARPAIVSWGVATFLIALSARRASWLPLALANLITALIAIGNYTMLAMAVSSDETRWLRFYQESLSGIMIGAAVLAAALMVSSAAWAEAARRVASRGRLLGISGSMAALVGLIFASGAAWRAFGAEAGIAGLFQPSEMIKTLFALVLAGTAALVLRTHFGGRLAETMPGILISLGFVVAILVFILVLPVINNDLSPFLIMLLTVLISFPLIWTVNYVAGRLHRRSQSYLAVAPPPGPPDVRADASDGLGLWFRFRRRLRRRAGASLASRLVEAGLLVIVPLIVLYCIGDKVHGWYSAPAVGQVSFEETAWAPLKKGARRADSWLDLRLDKEAKDALGRERLILIEYPDTGHQVIRSRKAIAAASCRAGWLLGEPLQVFAPTAWLLGRSVIAEAVSRVADLAGCSGQARPAPSEPVARLGIPEVQNDFVVPWAFHAIGRDGMLALAFLQVALIVLLLASALAMMRWEPGDEERRVVATFFANATIILAVMVALHFVIAWMNAFGLLPVMGQPMTYIAQGRSHFLLFALTVLILPVLGLIVTREPSGPVNRGMPRLKPWERNYWPKRGQLMKR